MFDGLPKNPTKRSSEELSQGTQGISVDLATTRKVGVNGGSRPLRCRRGRRRGHSGVVPQWTEPTNSETYSKNLYRAMPFLIQRTRTAKPSESAMSPTDGFVPLLSECGIAIHKPINSCTAALLCRAEIELAAPYIALDEHKRYKTIQRMRTLCARAGAHDLARPTSSANYQTVWRRAARSPQQLAQPSTRLDRAAPCMNLTTLAQTFASTM